MSFMSFRLIIKLIEGNPAPFVFLYSSGNLLSLCSSGFLSGPKRQMQWVYVDVIAEWRVCFTMINSTQSIRMKHLCCTAYICRYMFDDKRKMTSIVYLSSLGTSITVCFIPMSAGAKIGILVLLLLVQMCASLWYTLSYIPYGRATAQRMLRSVMAMDGEWIITMICECGRWGEWDIKKQCVGVIELGKRVFYKSLFNKWKCYKDWEAWFNMGYCSSTGE